MKEDVGWRKDTRGREKRARGDEHGRQWKAWECDRKDKCRFWEGKGERDVWRQRENGVSGLLREGAVGRDVRPGGGVCVCV